MRHMFKHSILALIALTIASTAPAMGQSTYTIPDDLTPVSRWAKGFTAQESQNFRTAYRAPDFFAGNDVSAYAFLHLSEVLPTMVVARGGQVAEMKSNPMREIGDVTATTQLGTMTLSEAIADPRSRLQAIAIVHKGQLVYEAYPGMPRGAKHLWSSSTKPVTGVLVHQLAAEGLIDLKAPVSTYLAFTKGKAIGDVPVGDVLHMRSGLDFEENQANRNKPNHPVAWAFAAALSARGVPAGKSLAEIVVEVPAIDPPNTVFGYSTFNTQVLSMIIEKATGKPWNEVFSERIWAKAGMEGDGLLGISPAGEPLAGGVFAATLRDFARFGTLFTPSWNAVASERVVPEDYFAAVAAASDPKIYAKGEMGKRMNGFFAGLGAPTGASYHWDAVWEDGDLYKSGLLGQALYVSPRTDTVIVWFSTTWQSAFPLTPYLRAIVQQKFRKK